MCHQTDISSRVTSCGKNKKIKSHFRWPNLMGNVLKSRRRLPSAVSLFVLGPQMGRKLKMNDRRAGTEELPLQKRESLSGSHSQWERLSLHKKGKKKKWIVPNRREAEHSRAQGNKEGKTASASCQDSQGHRFFCFISVWNETQWHIILFSYTSAEFKWNILNRLRWTTE